MSDEGGSALGQREATGGPGEGRRIGLRRGGLVGGPEAWVLVNFGFLELGSLRDHTQRVYPFAPKVHGY